MSEKKKQQLSEKENFDQTSFIPLIPLRDLVLFPAFTISLFIGRESSKNAVKKAMQKDRIVFLVAQKDSSIENPQEQNIFQIGVRAEILQMLKLPDGTIKILVETLERARIVSFENSQINPVGFFSVNIKSLPNERDTDDDELRHRLVQQYAKYLRGKMDQDAAREDWLDEDNDLLVDQIAGRLSISLDVKQEILEETEQSSRINKLIHILLVQIALQEIDRNIHNNVQDRIAKHQKDYYLGEKIKEIRKELGQEKDIAEEAQELRARVADKGMPKEAQEKVLHEISRLEKVPPFSAEVTVLRNYIDWMLDLPWQEQSKDVTDLSHAMQILERDHFGLEKIKDRILDFIVVRQFVANYKGPILCFVGPPGVGKTSLAQSIASSLGRQFIRMSLGGVRDEAEIRGHRKTYVAALPGRIIQSMKKSATVNPVFLLDEIDKLSTDFRGDPASALLEVLDPEQNKNFQDHFLEVPYDLSKVLFIATANALHRIPLPLRDRMEIIHLDGYSEIDKLQIARRYLLPKSLLENGLRDDQIRIANARVLEIIRYYTREAGVRSLNRVLHKVARKTLRKLVEQGTREDSFSFRKSHVTEFLGKQEYRVGFSEKKDEIGYANGLAWTEMGGDLLGVEVTLTAGRGGFTITGNLGDVMQESVKLAMTYFRSVAEKLGVSHKEIRQKDVHVHVPEGAIPKDGPSAGVTIACAIVSAFTGIALRKNLAMTGEITLRGKVLPVGGIKEKVLAAHRGKIGKVILPKENEKDALELPVMVQKRITIVLASQMEDILPHAFVSDPRNQSKSDIKELQIAANAPASMEEKTSWIHQ